MAKTALKIEAEIMEATRRIPDYITERPTKDGSQRESYICEDGLQREAVLEIMKGYEQ